MQNSIDWLLMINDDWLLMKKSCLKSLVDNSNDNNLVLNKWILEIYVFDSIHFQDKYMLS